MASFSGTAAALFYILLWASAYVPSKIGVLESSPLWFLACRFGLAGLLALALARAFGSEFPRKPRDWYATAALGLLANAAYLGLTYEALRHLASGVGAIIASTNPLVLALVAPYALGERLNGGKIAGLALGFGGVVGIMFARIGSGTAEPRDVALAFAGVMASVASTLVFKRYLSHSDVHSMTGLQLLAASLFLVPFAVFFEGRPHAVWSLQLAGSYVYLVGVISIGASLLWFRLLKRGEASRVTAYYFLTPVFGLLISAWLLHEPVGLRDLAGLGAIALGIALVQRS